MNIFKFLVILGSVTIAVEKSFHLENRQIKTFHLLQQTLSLMAPPLLSTMILWTALSLKPNISLLLNQFYNFFPDAKRWPRKCCELQLLWYWPNSNFENSWHFHFKNSGQLLFHINACSFNEIYYHLEHLLQYTNNIFTIVAVTETIIINKTSLSSNINSKSYSF